MRAYVIHGPQDLRLDDVPERDLGPREVRLALVYGGICGSDLHYVAEGRAGNSVLRDPMVLGHELSGRVVEAGSAVTDLAPGTPVAVNPALSCGACRMCRAGRTNLCFSMRYMGSAAYRPHTEGGFAERPVVDRDQCVILADDADLARAALAEPYSIAAHAVNRAGVAGARVLITGGGTIGALSAIAALRAGAARVTVADIQSGARERVAKLAGVDVLDAGNDDAIAALAADPAFDVAIEAAGAAAALNMAMSCVEPGARVVQVGFLPTSGIDLNLLITREIELLGSYRFVDEFDAAVAAVLADDRLAAAITGRHAFADAEAAFASAADKTRHLKVMIGADAARR
ncbi:alcohol dehydrogenase catalytic domain-containing protein [Salinisphaera sp.]|uniref:alcohol dehydrogenase catalytic domain-containing protein n=1 Tax=Salinisphaera sp. TaxID=1914330 RepID=UPI002D7928D3|nr:alcohol dehydrogenase catalytic domain-containing protein [Salinisphaera sp.]HET7314586.1 alcohol dehydrogenase catalytic domain-containing protein [Salinisphaera sp.]